MNESGGERPHLDEPKPLSELIPEVLDEMKTNALAQEHHVLFQKSTEGGITSQEEDRLDQLNHQLAEKFGNQSDPRP